MEQTHLLAAARFVLLSALVIIPAVALHRKRERNDRTHYRGGRQMIRYLLRRIGYGFLILIGVNLLTFMLFFTVNTPDDMARLNIGGKRVTAEAIQNWKEEHGYDKPLLWNEKAKGSRQAYGYDFLAAQCAADGRRPRCIGRGT